MLDGNTVDSRFLEYSISQTLCYLEQMCWALDKQLRQTNARYLKLLISQAVF